MATRNRLTAYLTVLVLLVFLTSTIYALNTAATQPGTPAGMTPNSIATVTANAPNPPDQPLSITVTTNPPTTTTINGEVTVITSIVRKVLPIAETTNTIPNGTNTLSIMGCENCLAIANALSKGALTGFVGNSTLTEAIATIAGNSMLVNNLIGNLTPDGFVLDLNTTSVVQQNASAYVAQWTASGNVIRVTVDVGRLRSVISNNGSNSSAVNEAIRAALPFINSTFNSTDTVNGTKIQIMHITDVINGTKTVAKYIPTNITAYQSGDGEVISISNMPGRVENKISLFGSRLPMRNITISTKGNLTTSAIAIKSYSGSSNTVAGRQLPLLPGNVMSYLQLNSTINESNINYINYTFNVTQAWLNDNKISPLHLSLYRLNPIAENWTKLPTVLIGSNTTAYIYRAVSPGMSIYAIAFSPINITTTNLVITITPQNILNGSNSTGLVLNSQLLSGNTILILVVVAAIAIIILYLYLKPPISLKPVEQKMVGDDSPIKVDYNS